MIIMGSQTDEAVMNECRNWLNWFGIENEMIVASAHRNPDKVRDLMVNAKSNGYGAIVAAAGMAAALPGVCSAYTSLPVLGVPLDGGLPVGWQAILRQWITGADVALIGADRMKTVEDAFAYKLVWALEAVRTRRVTQGWEPDIVAGGAAAAVETGVPSFMAAMLIRAGLPSRRAAMAAIQASDARTAEQQSQARQNHARQMAWLQGRGDALADDAPAPRHKRQRARTRRSARAAPVAVPLTSHRIGERPFERLGQQVTSPDKAQRHKRRRGDITARTPAQPRQTEAGARLDIKRRP